MTKRSRRTAARYSALSKEGKRRQHRKRYPQQGIPSTPRYQGIVEPPSSLSSISETVAKPGPRLKQALPGYEYLSADLKKIGIIAGSMLAILVVLAFVLG